MIRRAISSKMISAIHLPIREPFLLFSLSLAGLAGLYICRAFLLELENANECCTTVASIFLYNTSEHKEGCVHSSYNY